MLGLAFLPQASAKKLFYRYQDAQGIWHVAEIRPVILRTGEGKQHQAGDPRHKLIVQQRGSNKEPLFYFVNAYDGPVQVEVELTRLDNLQPMPPPPRRFMLPAASGASALKLPRPNPYQALTELLLRRKSRAGGAPNNRRYSRLNWLGLS